jgi:hypothetical protein
MARIRTIKPEFWTDERLTECSLSARLMFIGMWNFADDNGNMGYSAKRIKMQVFPADNIETQPLIDELLTHGVLSEYSVNGEKFLHIKGFSKHQVINRPSSTAIPKPQFSEDSVSTHGALTDGREGKGKERIKTPIPPTGAKTENAAIGLPTWLTTIKAKGEDPIPADDPVFEYADSVGIPREHLRLAWREFRERYSLPNAKRYRCWRTVFRKAVRGNWFKLWHFAGDACALTTTGVQAKRAAEANAGVAA